MGREAAGELGVGAGIEVLARGAGAEAPTGRIL